MCIKDLFGKNTFLYFSFTSINTKLWVSFYITEMNFRFCDS